MTPRSSSNRSGWVVLAIGVVAAVVVLVAGLAPLGCGDADMREHVDYPRFLFALAQTEGGGALDGQTRSDLMSALKQLETEQRHLARCELLR